MPDSGPDTAAHIERVRVLLDKVSLDLFERGLYHDNTKLGPSEKPYFDNLPDMKNFEYGSEEYRAALQTIKPAIEHHYAHNTHHPEHYENGVDGMSLLDVMEMLADWKAAGERTKDGNLRASIVKNVERFNISPQLQAILENTAKELDW